MRFEANDNFPASNSFTISRNAQFQIPFVEGRISNASLDSPAMGQDVVATFWPK